MKRTSKNVFEPHAPGPVVVGVVDMCRSQTESTVILEYTDAVHAAGAVPFILPATTDAECIAAALDRVDMLMFCGGEDVEPVRYGGTNHEKLGSINPRRDAWEFAVADEAIRRRMPLFGICRGCQVLNVRFGGTLWQDLPSEKPDAMIHGIKDEHGISIEPGTYLHAMLGADSASVNSRHHQAVKDLAKGFKVAARAPDGVIEAFESADYPVLCVQFHPESLVVRSGRSEFLPLFRGDFAKPEL